MINIVIPMAGLGSRFAQAGYTQPKPLIPVFGRAMIALVVANLRPSINHRFIFICQRALEAQHAISALLRDIAPGCEIILTDGVTEGAACSVLLAKAFIDNGEPLVIANCDQYVHIDINAFFDRALDPQVDGLVMTMPADHPKWSYVRRGVSGWVEEVREKAVISNEATVGIYHFQRGFEFVQAAHAMILRNERVNNEFYVAPVYNGLIAQAARIGTYDIGDAMFGIGTPDDLQRFMIHFNADLRSR
jgi:NDP-sugar pyrophosphorylase family protein